jgi:predicted NUDIX family NTP pyrophosphohydrolase
MPRISAGLLMYRHCEGALQILLVHPGGPFFKNKDAGAWSIPKGELDPDEDPLLAARREFGEELGLTPSGPFLPLNPVKQKGGKTIQAWACEGECDPSTIVSNTFTLEWPPKSGRMQEFPEVDRAAFFDPVTAREKINSGQIPLIDQLETLVQTKSG